jgi:phosphate transport system substrate-binding protein
MNATRITTTLAALLALALGVAGCPGQSTTGSSGSEPSAQASLVGAGATFPYPLYSKWIGEYEHARPGVKINYQSVGSGAGQRQLFERTVDFGASDAPLSDDQLAKAGEPVLHIPMTLGAIVLTFNLPEVTSELKLSPEVLAGIFLGEIGTWNDPKIAALNEGAKLPAKPIVVVHRSDGSGTTFVFTDYLSKISPAWKDKVGKGTAVKFPAGIGAKGNEGVTGQVKQSDGAIGYVELIYAKANRLPVASLKNRAGKIVSPSIESVTAAAAAAELTEDLRMSITDAPGEGAWPISSFTWILVWQDQKDEVKGRAIAELLAWCLGTGQSFSTDLHYAPLPPAVIEKAKAKVALMRHDGKPLGT